ncbi:MAG: hypothetical protein ACI9TV_000181 [Sulfurimonas sp.]|jgi:hypothetical protein|uniref:hypothetical protein n=1 Tax=Sulfurimonas sp. TaxID=2022749 RepID=UPI0039E5A6BE
MEAELKIKLEKVVELVDNLMVDPEIDIEYCIPGVAMTSEVCDMSKGPYIELKYIISEYTQPTRKIHLTSTYTSPEAKVIANLVTFSVEEFKAEIDSVEMG